MEISHLLAEQVGAARLLEQRHPGRFQFGLSKSKNLKPEFFNAALERAGAGALPSLKVIEDSHALLSASDVALTKSGTTTLEATLYRTPMVVMYRGAWWAYRLARLLMTVRHISLPNNLAGREVVPELWQYDANAQKIADTAERLLEPARHAAMKHQLDAIARQFADADTPRRAAQAVVRLSHAT